MKCLLSVALAFWAAGAAARGISAPVPPGAPGVSAVSGEAGACGASHVPDAGVFGTMGPSFAQNGTCHAPEREFKAYQPGLRGMPDPKFFCFGDREIRHAWEALTPMCTGEAMGMNRGAWVAPNIKVGEILERRRRLAVVHTTPAPHSARMFPPYVEH